MRTLGHNPTASIPLASRNSSDAQSIYRFWSNSKVMPETILQGHIEGTAARARGYQPVLSIQDSTDLDFTSHPHTKGFRFTRFQALVTPQSSLSNLFHSTQTAFSGLSGGTPTIELIGREQNTTALPHPNL